MDCLVDWCMIEDESRFIYFALCCIVTCSLSVFSQLSLEVRGIATKGMQYGFLGGLVHMIVIVGLTRKAHLFYIVLTHNLFPSPFTARGIATKGARSMD